MLIPEAVFEEIVAKKGGMPRRAELTRSAWIRKASVADRSKLDELPNVLHQGEREAIALAEERGAQLLIDEIRGRRAATERGIEVVGTLRVLSYAKQFGLIEFGAARHRADAVGRVSVRSRVDLTIP